MAKKAIVVNFGSSKGGLSTVGYTIYNSDGTTYQARTTAGVSELGTSTGIYFAEEDLGTGFAGMILWDTGEATPRYAPAEANFGQLNQIDENADKINLIWNYFREERDSMNRLFEMVRGLKGTIQEQGVAEELNVLLGRPAVALTDIEELLHKTIKPVKIPEVKIPKIPDYSSQLRSMEVVLSKISKAKQAAIPRDYLKEFALLSTQVKELQKALSETKSHLAASIASNTLGVAKKDDLSREITGLITENNSIIEMLKSNQREIEELKKTIDAKSDIATFFKGLINVIQSQGQVADALNRQNDDINKLLLIGGGK